MNDRMIKYYIGQECLDNFLWNHTGEQVEIQITLIDEINKIQSEDKR